MAIFDWSQIVGNEHADWLATKGKGVKIALIDSGLKHEHPAFSQLNKGSNPPHYFWVARPGYDPKAPLPAADDDVTEPGTFSGDHGTACAAVLAAEPESEALGIRGIAPQAELFMIKCAQTNSETNNENLINALDLALRLKVDIISCSVLPIMTEVMTDGRIQEIFDRLRESRTLLFASLKKTDVLERLNKLGFPVNRPESIVVGVATPVLLGTIPPGGAFNPKIDFLHPAVSITNIAEMGYSPQPAPCAPSLATAALAAMAALRIAKWKADEGAAYQRRSRETVVSELKRLAKPFSLQGMLSSTTLQFFSLHS